MTFGGGHVWCPKCGRQNQQIGQFCTSCGGPLQPDVPTEPAPSAPAIPAAYAEPAQPPPKTHGCRNSCLGCGTAFAVVALIVLVAVGWFFRWPAEIGLVDTPGEKLFASPDPYATDALALDLQAAGVDLAGIKVLVLPGEDGPDRIAYMLLDEAEGFAWSHPEYDIPTEGLLVIAANAPSADTYGIERVAVDYRAADGTQVALMTAPTSALRAYASGTLDQEGLFAEMDAMGASTE